MAEPHNNQATHSRDLPTTWRYVRARLRILQRPAVWGSTVLVLLTILVFFEYWRQSDELGRVATPDSPTGVASLDQLPADGTTTGEATLPSEEDRAIGADIDTLPLLLNDLNSSPPATNNRDRQNQRQGDRSNNNRESSQSQSARSNPAPNPSQSSSASSTPNQSGSRTSTAGTASNNPFGALLSNNFSLLPSATNSSSRSTVPSAGSGLSLLSNFSTNSLTSNSRATPATAAPSNPLSEALLRNGSSVDPTASSTESSTAQGDLEALAQSSGTPQASGTTPLTNPYGTLYSNPYNNPYNAPYSNPYGVNQVPPFLYTPSAISNGNPPVQPPMQVSPPMGSTGYTLPPSLRGVPSSAPNSAAASPYTNSFQNQPIRSFPTAPQIVPSAIPLQPSGASGQSAFPTPPLGTPGSGSGMGSMPQFSTPQAVPQRNLDQMPYSVPNRVPGRNIGNGEINTFANP